MHLTRFRLVEGCGAAFDSLDGSRAWRGRSGGKWCRQILTNALLIGVLAAILPSLARAQNFTPSQIQQAYGLNLISSVPTGAYTGAGQTIAVIEAYGTSTLVSDVGAFDNKYNLPAPPSLTLMTQTGSTTGLPAPNNSTDWAEETTLDVEWAHAIAPLANIEVVQANSANDSDIYAGASYAASSTGGKASVVSMSFSGGQDNGYDSTFVQSGVTFVASTGDKGTAGGVPYPAASPNVVAVGGTSLKVDSNGNYKSETAWSGSGGGTASYEAEPASQYAVQKSGERTVPDVAFDANPDTGVDIVYGGNVVNEIGGTSLSAPAWAGLFALADQELASTDKPLLSSASALSAMYATYSNPVAYNNVFHDITSNDSTSFDGYTTYATGPGYDEATGLGSPIANELIPYLGGQLTLAQLPEPTSAAVILIAMPILLKRRVRRR